MAQMIPRHQELVQRPSVETHKNRYRIAWRIERRMDQSLGSEEPEFQSITKKVLGEQAAVHFARIGTCYNTYLNGDRS